MEMQNMEKTCPCKHHKIVPVLIVVLGLVFLLGRLGMIAESAVSMTWPIVIILIGLVKYMGGSCGCYGEKHW